MIKTIKAGKISKKDIRDLILLYKEKGWWDKEPSSYLKKMIKGSFIFAAYYEKGKIAGMGRIISDGISDAYIQDLAVFKKYEGKGIGTKILNFLSEKSKKFSFLSLIAQNKTEKFYKKNGFRKAKNAKAMLYDKIRKTEKYGL
ncbi:MAG: GNAT family N-acetyltransferase [Elusimicrobiota bacterium]